MSASNCSATGARLVFVPGAAAVTPAMRERFARADAVLFDGTLFTDDEMLRTGTGQKTGRRMGHMPIDGEGGTLAGARRAYRAAHFRPYQQHQSDPDRRLARAHQSRGRRLAGRRGRHGDRVVKLLSPERTGSRAARHRRQALSPAASVSRPAARRQMQQGPGAGLGAQPLLLSGHDPDQGRQPDRALRGFGRAPRMALAPGRSRRRARRRRRHRALAQAHRRARARPRLRHLAARPVAGHALCGRGLCAFRAREDAAGSDRLLAHRNVLAGHHQRAHGRDAGELSLRHARNAELFRQAPAAGRSATPISRSITSSDTPRRPSSSRRCSPRSNSNAACCGRCWTRSTTPMWRPSRCRRALLCRAHDPEKWEPVFGQDHAQNETQ